MARPKTIPDLRNFIFCMHSRVFTVPVRPNDATPLLLLCFFPTVPSPSTPLFVACHDWLLGKEVGLLTHLLLPLAGPEEFSDEEMDKLPVALQVTHDCPFFVFCSGHNLLHISCAAISTTHLNTCTSTLLWSMNAAYTFFVTQNTIVHREAWILNSRLRCGTR